MSLAPQYYILDDPKLNFMVARRIMLITKNGPVSQNRSKYQVICRTTMYHGHGNMVQNDGTTTYLHPWSYLCLTSYRWFYPHV